MLNARAGQELRSLLQRLEGLCYTPRDRRVVDWTLAQLYASDLVNNPQQAAAYLMQIIERDPWPLRMRWAFRQAVGRLRQADSPAYMQLYQRYIDRIGNEQNLVPELYRELGTYQLQDRNRAVLETQRILQREYPASTARDQLDTAIRRAATGG